MYWPWFVWVILGLLAWMFVRRLVWKKRVRVESEAYDKMERAYASEKKANADMEMLFAAFRRALELAVEGWSTPLEEYNLFCRFNEVFRPFIRTCEEVKKEEAERWTRRIQEDFAKAHLRINVAEAKRRLDQFKCEAERAPSRFRQAGDEIRRLLREVGGSLPGDLGIEEDDLKALEHKRDVALAKQMFAALVSDEGSEHLVGINKLSRFTELVRFMANAEVKPEEIPAWNGESLLLSLEAVFAE